MALSLDYEKHIRWWYSETSKHKMLQYQHFIFFKVHSSCHVIGYYLHVGKYSTLQSEHIFKLMEVTKVKITFIFYFKYI